MTERKLLLRLEKEVTREEGRRRSYAQELQSGAAFVLVGSSPVFYVVYT